MNNNKLHYWQPLAQHGPWKVEYCREVGMLRLHVGDQVIQLAREAYQTLWGTLTEGLDALEVAEDAARTQAGWAHGLASRIEWPQTRH